MTEIGYEILNAMAGHGIRCEIARDLTRCADEYGFCRFTTSNYQYINGEYAPDSIRATRLIVQIAVAGGLPMRGLSQGAVAAILRVQYPAVPGCNRGNFTTPPISI